MTSLLPNISNDVYHAHPAIGSSRLKQILKCPALYQANIPIKTTPAMDLGTVVHAMVLEPDTLQDVVVIAPKFAGKGAQAARAEFKANHEGRILLSAEDMAKAHAMASNVLALPDVSQMLDYAVCEHSGFYNDPATGLACKYRPDIRTDWVIADVKTASDASVAGFSRAIENFGYALSAAHYLTGDQALTGSDHRCFCFLVVESSPPYLAAAYILDAESLGYGEWQRAMALTRIAACNEANEWPSFNNGEIRHIGVPRYALREYNDGE